MITCFGGPVVATCLAFAVCATAEDQWKTFESKKFGYRVTYPASWHLFTPEFGALNILNFPPDQRIQGVVIRDGGAEISVIGGPAEIHGLDDWIKKDVTADTVLDRRDIEVPPPSPGACGRLTRVVSMQDVSGSGKAFQVSTSFYCMAKGALYKVTLTNWKDDPRQPQYQNLALQIALSLRERTSEK